MTVVYIINLLLVLLPSIAARKAKCESTTLSNGFLLRNEDYSTLMKNSYSYAVRNRYYCIAIVQSDWNYVIGSKKSDDNLQSDSNETLTLQNSSQIDNTIDDTTSASYLEWRDKSIDEFSAKSTRRLDGLTDAYTFSKVLLKQYEWIDGAYTDPVTGAVSIGYCNWESVVDTPAPNGFLGPILRAVVGDTLVLNVKNMLKDQSYSIHAHGMSPTSTKSNQTSSIILSESVNTYTWYMHEYTGANDESQFSSNAWKYTFSPISETYSVSDLAALVGAIIVSNSRYITSADYAESAMPCDIIDEFFLYQTETTETTSSLYQEWTGDTSGKVMIQSINGYSYGHLDPTVGLTLTQGQNVRWFLLGSSTSNSFHIYWNGNNVLDTNSRPVDTAMTSSSQILMVDMEPLSIGYWDIQVQSTTSTSALVTTVAYYSVSILQYLPSSTQTTNERKDDRSNRAYGTHKHAEALVVTVGVCVVFVAAATIMLGTAATTTTSAATATLGGGYARFNMCPGYPGINDESAHATTAFLAPPQSVLVQVMDVHPHCSTRSV